MSSRLTVSLHVLTLLALVPDRPLTSEYIARSVNTHAVVIRRVLALLRRKRLVRSRAGNAGGWELARHPGSITVLDVRQAVDDGPAFAMHSQRPSAACPVGRDIQRVLEGVYAHATRALDRELQRTTVAALLESVRK